MSSPTWTPDALASSFRRIAVDAWRLVEVQHVASTMKLTRTLREQAALERILEAGKPPLPTECAHLDVLLAAPFRYRPYPAGSRFRRAGLTPGVFYASRTSTTAAAELAFYRLLFFAESPATPWPANAADYAGFSVALSARKSVDLRAPPFDETRAEWEHPIDYGPCQAMESVSRAAGADAIIYRSVRDPAKGANYAILRCTAFAKPHPLNRESWRIHLGPAGVRAVPDFPVLSLEFTPASFAADPRIAAMNWER